MIYQKLHTYTLEKLFGTIHNQVIKQNNTIRMVHLMDSNEISRTLGVVKFEKVNDDILVPHNKIRNGAMLGKTLLEFNVDFDKQFIGTIDVELPEWLKNDFNTREKHSKAFLSRILIKTKETVEDTTYAELIEVIPPEIIHEFNEKIKQQISLEPNWQSLIKDAGLKVYSYEK